MFPGCSGGHQQWRRQDSLRGGAKMEIMSRALTADFRAGCSSCLMTNSFVTDAVLFERAVSCWHLHQLISQTTQYLDSLLSDLLQSELKIELLKVEGGGARAPVTHSWRRHWRAVKVNGCSTLEELPFYILICRARPGWLLCWFVEVGSIDRAIITWRPCRKRQAAAGSGWQRHGRACVVSTAVKTCYCNLFVIVAGGWRTSPSLCIDQIGRKIRFTTPGGRAPTR